MESSKRFNPYVKVPPDEEIVISGIAGRFPNSDNIKLLQENLLNKTDLGSEDDRRWSSVDYDIPARSGKINNVEKFDAQYFNMTFSKAHTTDPMCRMLLEHTYEAIIDAGVNPKELRGTRTGVFIGSCYSESTNMILYHRIQVFSVIGCSKYWLANSISNWLGLNGPSYAVDTACSSSSYAIMEAYRMIRSGECDAAIVGGANLCLHPNITLQFYNLGVLSADGYCKPFDISGSGYMRSETIAIIYLQKAKDARRIYATFVYAKTNSDGFKEEGITYPSMSMQKKLLEEFYDDCGVTSKELSYMEAHATGTTVGDPVEVDAIDQALCSKRTTPLLVGSVKSNLGHSEPGSGLCQVAKVVIAMETGIIPPTIHYEIPRKELTAIIEGRIKIVTEPTTCEGGYMCIHSSGFGGANCHILLKSNPKNKINNALSDDLPRLVVVSGRTEEAVKTLLDDVNSRELDVEYVALLHRVHAENIEGHPYRGYTITGLKTARNTIKNVGNSLYIGLVDLLIHIGISPDYMIGLSIGDLICEYVDGIFTTEETILMAYYMGIVFEQFKIQIDNITTNCCKYFESIRAQLLQYLSHLLPLQSPKSRGVIWLGRSRIEFGNTCAAMAEYYVDNLLYPATLENIIPLISNDTVLVEMMPENILQTVITKSLKSKMTLVSLCKHGHASTIQDVLEGIGDFYNIGFQPQISNLYPPIQFPVSRGTPMISPLVRWNHSEDYFLFRYKGQEKIFSREVTVNITTVDADYEYMSGHVIDGKNLLPATGYLFLIWHMISLLSGIDYRKIPIVFGNVKFVRATSLSKKDELKLILLINSIQKDSNNFEIMEGNDIIVSGVVRIPDDIMSEKLPVQYLSKHDDNEKCNEYINTADIYKELRLRGYQYTGLFRSLKSASFTRKIGRIKWLSNWVAFMDNMLQIKILSNDSRSTYVPTQIDKLVIDPTYHLMQVQNVPIGERDFPVYVYDYIDAIVSGGVEISGLKATAISRRVTRAEAIHEEYRFIAYRDHALISLKEAIKLSVHIALECYELKNVKVIEYVEDNDELLLKDLVTPVVQEVINNLPLIRSNLTLVAKVNRFDSSSLPPNLSISSIVQFNKLAKDNVCLLAIGVGILTKNIHFMNRLLSSVMTGGFLLSREDLSATYDYSLLQRNNLNIILEKRTEQEVLVLLKKAVTTVKIREIVYISNHEFSWINKLKDAMNKENESNTNTKITVVAEGDSECGVLGLVNCLRKEPDGEMIQCIFIQDKDAPKFSLQEPFYMEQLQLNLPINVLRPGKVWGSYRHFSLHAPEPRLVQYGYVLQETRGDLSALRWVEGRISTNIKHIKVFYVALNFKDIMIATGKLSMEAFKSVSGRDVDSILGYDFVGFDKSGQRIMGIHPGRAMSNIIVPDYRTLTWDIPDEWTFEDAATVPCVYITCYYALYVKGKIKKGDKVLIHSGSGGVGQAAINLALNEECEIFTTVGTLEKRQFIRETFPCIPDNHIGNSRDTSFEQMIVQQTHGRGVDIVLNSLAEEKLQASVRCLARGGRFLEIGKYDLISNNILDKIAFARGISFHGVMLDNIICHSEETRKHLHDLISQGLKKHVIKMLPRKVFEKTEIEAAFRYMAAGKHIGKILIKIRDENEPLDLPILAHPRFFCEPHKSYIILGGLGGFGLELADWLILREARKLVLTSRTGIRNGYQRSRVELWKSYGVDVQIIAGVDASIHEDCANILNFAATMGPVDAIFNLAVVLKDAIYKNQTTETFEESFKPKARTTKMLDELSRKMCTDLRHFIVFSSVSCGRGNAGQTNYGMANSIMERICEKRVQDGFPGMAIQWGAVGDVGLVADMVEDNKELVIGGTLQQRILSCLQSLDAFLVQSRPIVGSMVVAEKGTGLSGTMNILETVANIMGLKDIRMVGRRTALSEIGMDSMMAVEIKQTLEREFDVHLTAQDIRNLTIEKLCKMADTDKSLGKESNRDEPIVDMEGIKSLLWLPKNLTIVPDICLELSTKHETDRERVFLIPGIEGCGSVFNWLAPKIKAPATCLQHGANNISTCESVLQSAVTLLPHVLTRMKNSKNFVLVGYSYGSVICIELARLLEAKSFTGRLILIDGTPEQMKTMKEQYFPFTTIQEFQNNVLLGLMDLFYSTDSTMIRLELSKHDTWEQKLDAFIGCIPDEFSHIHFESYRIYATSIYKHLLALDEYDTSSLPLLKSPILLLKPTVLSMHYRQDDYDLSKMTKGSAQIHYVEGNHFTMLENDEITAAINGDIVINK
ncbi:fatty acid synthase-like isoform X2 [Odontomachus brunneus]|uniref:fatty acid synthase-like isoform X2 n=1 Tax=Odontomachus brunneus TaxID=486640 RepID=UPI0013F20AFF|nr:fatty acid synthase-like isoform X2 [Odontomachus brunneus]